MSEAQDRDALVSLEERVKRMIVRELRLKQAPESIDSEAPLFEDGLGLDSIDALQLIVALEKEFQIKIETQADGMRILRSVRTIAQHILDEQKGKAST